MWDWCTIQLCCILKKTNVVKNNCIKRRLEHEVICGWNLIVSET